MGLAYMKGMSSTLSLLITVLLAISCTNSCEDELGPEEVVESYLDIALNMTQPEEKESLMALTTGSLKAAISSASNETIKSAYIDKSYKMGYYSVVERRDRTPRETEVTFLLNYKDLGKKGEAVKEDEAATITTENTVIVIRENEEWLIREVLGQKSTIDFPVSEASRITAKAPD